MMVVLPFCTPEWMWGEEHRDGVKLLLTRKMHKSLLKWHPILERILLARFRSKVRSISIIRCYASTEVAEESNKMKFYKQIAEMINMCNKKDVIVVIGDLNAKVGSSNRSA